MAVSRYSALSPEVAGHLGDRTVMDYSRTPYHVKELEYEFDDWGGDDLLAAFPCYIVSARLRAALEDLQPTGCEFRNVMISRSQLFLDINGDAGLPRFDWLVVTGTPSVDDFGVSDEEVPRLIVSQRILDLLKSFSLQNCRIARY